MLGPGLSYPGGPGLWPLSSAGRLSGPLASFGLSPPSVRGSVRSLAFGAELSLASQVGPGGAWEARSGIPPPKAGGDLGAGRWESARPAGARVVKGVAPGGAAGGRPGTEREAGRREKDAEAAVRVLYRGDVGSWTRVVTPRL